jgi:hypothetical protein
VTIKDFLLAGFLVPALRSLSKDFIIHTIHIVVNESRTYQP